MNIVERLKDSLEYEYNLSFSERKQLLEEIDRLNNIIDEIKKLCDENTNGIDDDGYDDAYYDRVYVREIEEIIENELKKEKDI